MENIKLPKGVTINRDVWKQKRVYKVEPNHMDIVYIGIFLAITMMVIFSLTDISVQQTIFSPIYATGGGK